MMLLTGCQGDPDPSAQPNPDPSSSASPAAASPSATPSPSSTSESSPASSAGPAANVPVPVKPALADENSAEGLEAFTKYWFELFSYGYETNDWAPFEAVTDPRCETCSNATSAVMDVYADGGWVWGADSEVTEFTTDFQTNTQGSIGSYVEVIQDASITFSASGEVEAEAPKGDAIFNAIFSAYIDHRWVMLDFGAPEGVQ
ncbi:DUF6318 family protein [Arthrobacter agilis]|uniref:DUF6318 family protein n=1 Tax=Arthrobacter agilis TaxID=37921 RepID=UPI00278140A9|nr:DUF6318 family protein [Arthrobacter agilis]MDQ0735412.1 hypothetical protein [Arthrobacter agilis]